MKIWVLIDHDRGALSTASLEALAFARTFGSDGDDSRITAVLIGLPGGSLDDAGAPTTAATLGAHGADEALVLTNPLLTDYGPEAYGAALAAAIGTSTPDVVLATGTDRGNEQLATAAARLDAPFMANVVSLGVPGAPAGAWTATRVRWGGSLHEQATLTAPAATTATALFSVALHAVEAAQDSGRPPATVNTTEVNIDPALARTIVADRIERTSGVTLATAPVVIGGGRGVGSAEAFAPLEALASELGGVVGCSRAVTNNGWRNHSDQVGQTGTRIAPDLYVAAGISGAIQHWVGAAASKNILAINTDPEANMVTKADYAVIGDLHELIPAITAEIRARRANK